MTYNGALEAQQHITMYRSIANYGDNVLGLHKKSVYLEVKQHGLGTPG